MDAGLRRKIVSIWAYNRSEVRKQEGIQGNDKDDWAYAERMLEHEIAINGEAFLIKAYSEWV